MDTRSDLSNVRYNDDETRVAAIDPLLDKIDHTKTKVMR